MPPVATGTWRSSTSPARSTRALRKVGSALSAALYAPQRAARWGAGVLVAVHLVGLNAWAWQERRKLTVNRIACATP